MNEKYIAFHVCISGFKQHEGNPHGLFRLYQDLINEKYYCNGRSRVMLYEWNDRWRNVAKHLWAVQLSSKAKMLIGVYAYSWGAGYGATKFAKELRRLGMKIQTMVLCDPVYRSPLVGFRWRSLLSRGSVFAPTVYIPENVGEVFSFHQTYDRPQGHNIVAKSNRTQLHQPQELIRAHTTMDDAQEFHAKAFEVADGIRRRVYGSKVDFDRKCALCQTECE